MGKFRGIGMKNLKYSSLPQNKSLLFKLDHKNLTGYIYIYLSCDTIISNSSENFMGLLMLNVAASRPSSGAVLQWGLRTTFENFILTEIAYNKAYWLSRAFKFRGEKIRKNLNRHARARVQDVKFGRLWPVVYAQSRNSLVRAWFPHRVAWPFQLQSVENVVSHRL